MKTIIIAEAGTNFASEYRRLGYAKEYACAAQELGADYIKYQMFCADVPSFFCPMDGDGQRWARWSDTFMQLHEWRELKAFCDEIGIGFLASTFQHTTVEWLKELQPDYYKVASRAATTFPYGACRGPFLISNGFSKYARPKLCCGKIGYILDCQPKYPTPVAEAMWDHRTDGLSDHSGTLWPGLDAIHRGARFLEVHFALDKADAGPDAPVCLTPDQLKTLCEARDGFALLRAN